MVILLQTYLKYVFRSTEQALLETLMITATLRSYDTLTAASGDVTAELLSPSCTPPRQSDTSIWARFAPSKESNTSLKGVKENARLQVVQRTGNETEEEDGEFVLLSAHTNLCTAKHLELLVSHRAF